jgi:hypothetical protein
VAILSLPCPGEQRQTPCGPNPLSVQHLGSHSTQTVAALQEFARSPTNLIAREVAWRTDAMMWDDFP